MNQTDSNFEDVKAEFTSFLTSLGQESRVLWIFREDVYSRRSDSYHKNFWLKLPLPATNEELAKLHFETGKSRGLGMLLIAFASCEEGLCCSFVVPTDSVDAQYMILGPGHVRLAFTNRDMPVAKVVRNAFLWKLLGFIPGFQHGNSIISLISKAELKDLE